MTEKTPIPRISDLRERNAVSHVEQAIRYALTGIILYAAQRGGDEFLIIPQSHHLLLHKALYLLRVELGASTPPLPILFARGAGAVFIKGFSFHAIAPGHELTAVGASQQPGERIHHARASALHSLLHDRAGTILSLHAHPLGAGNESLMLPLKQLFPGSNVARIERIAERALDVHQSPQAFVAVSHAAADALSVERVRKGIGGCHGKHSRGRCA